MTTIAALALCTLGAMPAQVPSAAPPAQALVLPPLVAPTREYVPPTPEEVAQLRQGIAYFERRDYDRALEVFQQVAKANPQSVMAIYEVGLTQAQRKEYQKAIDAAVEASAYRFSDLARVYSLIGNVLDWSGDPKRAIEVYRKGIEFAPAGKATLHFNMGITYVDSLKDAAAATQAFKLAVLEDPSHTSAQLMLAKSFLRESLLTPGLLATARFLILEPASTRIQEAYTMWHQVLAGRLASTGRGGMQITVNPEQSSLEGDLTKLDLFISLSRVNAMAEPGKSEIQRMVTQVESLLGIYASTKPEKDAATFLWSYYMPYFRELHGRGFVEPFVYFISQRTPFPGVQEWLKANEDRVTVFLAWSRNYNWPKSITPPR